MNAQYTVNLKNSRYFSQHAFALIPLRAGSKAALETGWPDNASTDLAQWESWRAAGYGLGIHAGDSRLIIVDLDTTKEGGRDGAWQRYAEWCKSHGLPTFAPHCSTARQGMHVYFKIPDNVDIATVRGRDLADGINVLCGRRYAVAPGSAVDFGSYSLFPNAPPPHVAPQALIEHCRRQVQGPTSVGPGQYDPTDVANLVRWLAGENAFEEYADWVSIGMALRGAGSDIDIWRLAHDDTVTADVEAAKWRSFSTEPKPGSVTLATWFKRAHQLGWKGSVGQTGQAMFGALPIVSSPSLAPCPVPLPVPPVNTLTAPREEILPPDCEDAHALEIINRHGDKLRYCEEWGRWLRWDGNRWHTDKTSAAFALIRHDLREFAFRQAFVEAKKTASAKTVAAVERLARTDQRIAVTADMWDADPMALNTPAGVVDLRTGKTVQAAPDFLMTKITAVAPGGECPTWLAFLHKSLAGDAELIGFVQRMLGYALTGDTREHALFFLFGPGGNGKGVLLNTVAGILGDYARTAPIETFTDSQHERHPTDLAGLRGARLVTASETEKGRRWAESKIKMLTGGDRIAARFMRGDFFEFMPQFKLVIAGNHKPGLRSVDEAIRRRLHLIPFNVKIPEAERDTALPERLKAEWQGILAWLIEGALAWQRGGLQPPAVVRGATEEYLSGEDAMATWLDERCERTGDAWTARGDLFMSWTRWAEAAREPVGTQKQFVQALRDREFAEGGRNGARGFRGVRLRDVPLPVVPAR